MGWKWEDYLAKAELREKDFIVALQKKFGGIAVSSCRKTDIKDHIDIWWTTNDGRVYGIDHKWMKKNHRYDAEADPTITWIELRNVEGKSGWIYGSADYISFDNIDGTYVVRRTDIVAYLRKKLHGCELALTHPERDFVPYRREGRQDIVVRVPFADIRNMAKTIVPISLDQ